MSDARRAPARGCRPVVSSESVGKPVAKSPQTMCTSCLSLVTPSQAPGSRRYPIPPDARDPQSRHAAAPDTVRLRSHRTSGHHPVTAGGTISEGSTDPMSTRPPLRVGLLVDSYVQPAWIMATIDDIITSSVATIALVVRNGSPSAEIPARGSLATRMSRWYANRHSLLFALHDRLDQRKFGTPDDPLRHGRRVARCSSSIPTIDVTPRETKFSDYFSDADVERIATYDLDVALRLGFRILRGRALEIARLRRLVVSPRRQSREPRWSARILGGDGARPDDRFGSADSLRGPRCWSRDLSLAGEHVTDIGHEEPRGIFLEDLGVRDPQAARSARTRGPERSPTRIRRPAQPQAYSSPPVRHAEKPRDRAAPGEPH